MPTDVLEHDITSVNAVLEHICGPGLAPLLNNPQETLHAINDL